MIGGHAVAQDGENTSAVDVGEGRRIFGHVFEVGRQLDVGGVGVPLVKIAFRNLHRFPARIPFENFAVFLAVLIGVDGRADGGFDFLRSRPNFAEINGFSGGVVANGFAGEIEIHAAGEGVSDHEWRGCEVVGANERMNASFEVAIAAEDRDGHHVVFLDGGADGVRERTTVADASGAAVADEVEIQFFEIGHQAGGLEVIGDDFGARSEAGFHPGLYVQTAFNGLFGEQTSTEHQRGVGGVGATGDGRDHDGTAGELESISVIFDGHFLGRGTFDDFGEGGFGVLQGDAILGALGTGDGGLDGSKIEFEFVAELWVGSGVVAEESLLLALGFDKRNLFVSARGETKIGEGFVVDGEEAHGGAVFGSHVGDGGAVWDAQAGEPGAVELDKFADDTFLAEHFGDGEDEVGSCGAFRKASVKFETDDLGNQHGKWLAEHGGFRFNSTDAPAEYAESIDHGGVGVGANEGIGVGFELVAVGHGANHAGKILDVDLMADAGVWRNDFEIAEGVLSPAEELVALDVALKFELGVEAEGIEFTEAVDLDGVVDDEFGGKERIDALGIAAEFLHGFAHGGEVDDGRNAGEVLQEHAGGHESSFFLRAVGSPLGEGANIVGMDEAAVFAAEEIFEKDTKRKGKSGDGAQTLLFQFFEAIDFEGLRTHVQSVARLEGICCGNGHSELPFEE